MTRPFSRYAIQRVESDMMFMPISIYASPANWFIRGLITAIGCAGIADWFFFEHDVGLSFAIFLTLLAVVSVWLNPPSASIHLKRIGWFLFAMGLLAVLEDLDFLSFMFGLMGLVAQILIGQMDARMAWWMFVPQAGLTLVSGPVVLIKDCLLAYKAMPTNPKPSALRSHLLASIVPIGFGTLFVVLFNAANPVIAAWVQLIGAQFNLNPNLVRHGVFWAFIVVAIWPLIHVRPARPWLISKAAASPTESSLPSIHQDLFGTTAVTRSLVLFNTLFAVQTVMDLAYLWGGAALPDGMTYATYAHRGAYPLIVTALLAAAFVLMAARSGSAVRSIKILLLVWIGQNVLLVLSSIFRVDLYVAAYSLTGWRIAAVIWMALVAVGLCLIVVRIVRAKTSGWLISANAAVLALTLYGCCLVDFSSLIAHYNVRHARECGGTGAPLDVYYLGTLPARALLAFDACSGRFDWSAMIEEQRNTMVYNIEARNRWVARRLARHPDWRSWSFHDWRMDRSLANTPRTLPTP